MRIGRSVRILFFPPLRYMLSVDNSPIGLLYYCELKAREERNRQLGDSAQTGATYFARHIEKIGQNRPRNQERGREKKACCYHGSLNSMCVCIYVLLVLCFLLFALLIFLEPLCPTPIYMPAPNVLDKHAIAFRAQRRKAAANHKIDNGSYFVYSAGLHFSGIDI